MIVSLFPDFRLAYAKQNTEFQDKVGIPQVSDNQSTRILKEVVEKRERNTKHFLKEDMSYEAVVYPTDVHYNEDGVWKEYDNTLVDEVEDNQSVLTNKQSNCKISISKNSSSKNLVKIKNGKYNISWGIDNPNKSSLRVVDKNLDEYNKLSENDKKKTLANLYSIVCYDEIWPNTDLEYIIGTDSIKENIVLKSNVENPVFQFNLNAINLFAVKNEDNTISFFSKDEPAVEVFRINAPFMVDADNNISENVEVALDESKDSYTLILKPDVNWLNNPNRVYPVKIDPYITTSLDNTNSKDSEVDISKPTTNMGGNLGIWLKESYPSGTVDNRGYVAFNLPNLSSADFVTKAEFTFEVASCTDNGANYVTAHEVLADWSESTITWGNKPSTNSKAEDYAILQTGLNTLDITGITKKWYTYGNNFGIMLKANAVGQEEGAMIISSEMLISTWTKPYVTVSYTNNTGLEDYWTYHSQEVGRAGNGYINDSTGNLTFVHNDLCMDGKRLPVTINHVYNSNESDSSSTWGNGWRLNLNQTCYRRVIDSIEYYEYTDEDGTKHYFKYDSILQKYIDESGINLELILNTDNTISIKDKGGNKLKFNDMGDLQSISDNNNNTLVLNYVGFCLKYVTDGTGRITQFNYDTNGKLISIVDPSSRTVASFEYTGDNLTKISYLDQKYTTFAYDTNDKLTSATNFDGYKISYEYINVNPYRISKVKEGNSNGTLGQELTFTYGFNRTKITDVNSLSNIYLFNDKGNTICIKDNDGSAQYYKYYSGTNINNKLALQSKLQKTVKNYLVDHGAEASSIYWMSGTSGGSTGTCFYTPNEKYYDGSSFCVYKTNTSGAHYYRQQVALEKGKTYTLSGYVKTNNISNSNSKGAGLFVTYKNSSGIDQISESSLVKGTNNWRRDEITFTLPANSTSNVVYVDLGIKSETGTAFFDCIQLEDGNIANRYNYMSNGDFSLGGAGNTTPPYWSIRENCSGSDMTVTNAGSHPQNLDSTCYKITGEFDKDKKVKSRVDIYGNAGDALSVGGWAKGSSVPLSDNRAFEIGLELVGETTQYVSIPFNEDSSEWQYVCDKVIAEDDFWYINFIIRYSNNLNEAYFDGMQLYKEKFGSTFGYDVNGNLTGMTGLLDDPSQLQYNANNDLTSVTAPEGNTLNLVYDTSHNLLNMTSQQNVVKSFTYDSYGNVLTEKVGNDTQFIKSSNTYTTDGNYIKTSTNPSGNVVIYNYDTQKGTLTSLVDPKTKTTNYTYDSLDRMTEVYKTVDGVQAKNTYAYENDKMKTITHNGFSYSFNYDSLGNNTQMKVGTQPLITNTYESRTSRLLESTFGNSQKIGFTYDNLDRVLSKSYNENVRFKYSYDNNGNLGYHEDLVNGTTFRYSYDLEDKLTEIKDSKGNSINYVYDKNSRKTSTVEKAGSNTYTTGYLYDGDDRLTTVNMHNGSSIGYSYDILDRLSSKIINTGSAQFNTSLTYRTGVNGSSTEDVQSINNNGNTISYTYDANGNIETITQNGKQIKYYYNELNELKREDNQVINKTITYTYDVGGNIESKVEYNYTTSTPTTIIKTYTYTYNTSWKDKLITYDGKTITYDAIGNPTNDGTYSYTWEEGRQLEAMSKTGQSLSFKYNDEGIRTEKIVNGVSTKYNVVDGKVTFETNGTDSIYYSYDSEDNLVGMSLNGTVYWYVRNSQGDIIGIIDSTGTQVLSYTYDTWGKLISITGTLASTVGQKNPYRYRGYRYDTETGLYYLQSRYYNPAWGRFVNADDVEILKKLTKTQEDLLDVNLFVYCLNNPVNMDDPDGNMAQYALVAGAANSWNPVGWVILGATAVVTVGIAIHYYSEHKSTKNGKKRNKHEEGNSRRKRDQGGERKKQKPEWKRPR